MTEAKVLTPEYLESIKESHNLTDEEISGIFEAFNMFDKNRNGYIDSNELGSLLNILGQYPSKEELETMMNDLDVIEKDGQLEFKEFVIFFKEHAKDKETQEKELRAAFRVFDMDNNGKIDKRELHRALTKFGERLSDKEIEDMMREADEDQDGKLSYDEFVNLFLKEFK